MYKAAKLLALAALFSAFAVAETWTGTLVDSACMDSKKSSAQCAPTASTTTYALVLAAGKTVKLDDAGNANASEALRNSADRSKNPDGATAVSAKVTDRCPATRSRSNPSTIPQE